MPSNRTRRSERPAPMFESLEPRLLLSAAPQNFTDWDGDLVTVSLTGPGSMAIDEALQNVGNPRLLKITLSNVEGCESTLTIKVAKAGGGDGFVNVGRITGNGESCGLHALDAPTTNIVGTATVNPLDADGDGSGYGIDLDGYVQSLNVHNILNGADVLAKQGAYLFPTCIKTTFTAWDIGQDTSVTLGSWVDSMKVHSWDVGGLLDAKGLTKLDATGNFGADLTLRRGPTAGPINVGGSVVSSLAKPTDWVFLTDVGAITVGGGSDNWDITATAAAMPSLTSKGNLSFGTIQALSLAKLNVTSNLTSGALTLTQVVDGAKLALGTTTISGTLGDGTAVAGAPVWTIAGTVGAITVGASGNDWDFDAEGAVKSMTCKGNMAFTAWEALSLGKLAVTVNLVSGALSLTQVPGAATPALGSATIGGQVASGGVMTWAVAGDVGTATIGSSAATWTVAVGGTVTSLTVKANLALASWRSQTLGTLKVTGDMNAGVMRLQNAATSINSITIGGLLTNSTIRTGGNIGSFKAKGMTTANLFAGVDPLGNTGDVTNLTARIGSVNVTGQATALSSHWMAHSEIHAALLGSAFIQGPEAGTDNVLALVTIPLNVIKIRRFDGVSYTYNSNWPADAISRLQVVDL